MKAIAERYPMGEAAVRAIAAGVDLLLICHRADRQSEAIEAIAKEARHSPAFRARVEEAAARVDTLCARFVAPAAEPRKALAALETAQHRELAARVAQARAEALRDPTEWWPGADQAPARARS
jgi:beta-N-acetylhexosaminidase